MQTRNQKTTNFVNDYIKEIKNAIDAIEPEDISEILKLIIRAYRNNSTIYILGNGGSAAAASHMATDLSRGTLSKTNHKNQKRLKAISLTENTALITAYANDFSYDDIFVEQLKSLLKKDDLVIAISGSGNSMNVINAIKYAKSLGTTTIGLLGYQSGGKLGKLVDRSIIAQSNQYGPIEDIHLIINHLLTSLFLNTKNDINAEGK